jgi:N-acetylmuramoyl-L-alanine amidase
VHWQPSPNFNERPSDNVSILVLHYTGMRSASEALSRMCDENAQVSAHYMVDEDGAVIQMVAEERRAWHAGVSHWRGRDNLNDISIGIEIVNPGHEFGYRAFPKVQMEAVAALSQAILKRHPSIPARNVIAHSDIAPARKQDPGELFDWKWLASQGVGLWVDAQDGFDACDAVSLQNSLKEYGYKIEATSVWDAQTKEVVIAFQRHFRQRDISGVWDGECMSILANLLKIA